MAFKVSLCFIQAIENINTNKIQTIFVPANTVYTSPDRVILNVAKR